jgi:hypothetical protein
MIMIAAHVEAHGFLSVEKPDHEEVESNTFPKMEKQHLNDLIFFVALVQVDPVPAFHPVPHPSFVAAAKHPLC